MRLVAPSAERPHKPSCGICHAFFREDRWIGGNTSAINRTQCGILRQHRGQRLVDRPRGLKLPIKTIKVLSDDVAH